MFCIQCGQQLDEGSEFCIQCGAPVETEDAASIPANIPAAEWPAVNRAGADQIYDNPHHGIPTASVNRRIVIGVTIVALLAVVSVYTMIMRRGRGDEHAPAASGTAAGPHTDPAILGEVSLYHIERVVYGRLSGYPNIDVGAAFREYFDDFRWDNFLNGRIHFVSFVGTMSHDGSPTTAQVLFRFTADDTAFSAYGLFIEGIIQDNARLYELLDSIFESAAG